MELGLSNKPLISSQEYGAITHVTYISLRKPCAFTRDAPETLQCEIDRDIYALKTVPRRDRGVQISSRDQSEAETSNIR